MTLFQSVWTLVVMIVFLSIIVWAYSRKRKPEFDKAAVLIIEDDDSIKTTVKE